MPSAQEEVITSTPQLRDLLRSIDYLPPRCLAQVLVRQLNMLEHNASYIVGRHRQFKAKQQAAEVVLPSKLWDTFFTIMTDSMSLASLYCAALHYKGAENAHPNLCKAGVAVMFLCEDLERPDIAVKGPVALRQKKFVEVIEKTAAIVRSLRQEYSKETDPLERMTNDPPLS
ncbi:hypothetical protein MMC24_006806 [Lignoscripta atroalba]|nr:hypothetical protein [Lignoscripta atroalba]